MKHIPLIGILWVIGVAIAAAGLVIAISTAIIVVPIAIAGLLYLAVKVQKET